MKDSNLRPTKHWTSWKCINPFVVAANKIDKYMDGNHTQWIFSQTYPKQPSNVQNVLDNQFMSWLEYYTKKVSNLKDLIGLKTSPDK